MPDLVPVLHKDEIADPVADLAQRVSSDYHGRELILIAALKSAFVFLSESYIVDCLNSFGPHSVKVRSLVDKIDRWPIGIKVDTAGHVVANGFLTGTGSITLKTA